MASLRDSYLRGTGRARTGAGRWVQQPIYGPAPPVAIGSGSTRTRNITLSPEYQRLFDTLTDTANDRALEIAGQAPLDADFSADAERIERATYDRALGLFRPQLDERRRVTEQTLANQGIPLGSEAYADQWDIVSRAENEALQNLALDAVTAGRAEQGRLFSQALTARRLPYEELAALLSGVPQFTPPPVQAYQIAPPDVMGAQQLAHEVAMNNYNAAMSRRASVLDGLLGLGQAALGMFQISSARAAKTIAGPADGDGLLAGVEALEVGRWSYRPGFGDAAPHVGPYAEDFARLFGVGDGRTIAVVDALGVLFGAVKALAARVRSLEGSAG